MSENKSSNLVLKVVLSEWKNESRDKRELSVIKDLGADVLVLAKGDKSGIVQEVDGFKVYRMSTRPLGKHIPNAVNRMVSLFTWAHQARKISPQIISGHDIIALLIGYMSTIFAHRKRKPKLVYDSHEFEIGRIENSSKGKASIWLIMHLERFLMKKCVFSIMVNDSIADEVQKIHKLEKRPVVARNIPDYWNLNSEKISQRRIQICSELNIPYDTFFVMYHGIVVPDRGIENMFKAIVDLPNTAAVILGNGADDYIVTLKQLAKELGIADRVLFKKAVSMDKLGQFVAAVDVGIIVAPAACKSYYFGLPNKLFENIQALTPVIVSHYPEFQRIIDKYEIGISVDPTNLVQITEAVKKMKMDTEFYRTCKENLKIAKEQLCWENEKASLKKAYSEILK